jgi:phosphoenolpyruvate synthase/pyruvate phosphate dikinase
VNGEVDANQLWERDLDTQPVSPPIVRKLFSVCREMAKKYGKEADIEWVVKSDTIFFLQIRPITHEL